MGSDIAAVPSASLTRSSHESHPSTRPWRSSVAGGAGTQAALFVAAGAVVGVIIGGAIAFLRSAAIDPT